MTIKFSLWMRFFHHSFHEVYKDSILHLMPVEVVGKLIDIGLKVEQKMVDVPQPGFEQQWKYSRP